MKNSYYIVELPDKNSRARLNSFLALGEKKRLAHDNLHIRESLNGTKVLIQGIIPQRLQEHITGKSFITYLGDCINGVAEQKIHDFLASNIAEWEVSN